MRILNFDACSLLQVFFGLILFQHIACDCEFPDNEFPDGKIIYQSPSDVNETIANDFYMLRFECNPGFQLIGRRYVQCIDTEWLPEIPLCASVTRCPEPPSIGNATYVVKDGVNKFPLLRSYVVYTCNEGYELEDKEASILRCTSNIYPKRAVWTGKMPSCKEKSCPDPGVSTFGNRTEQCCLVGTSLQFQCHVGHKLVGEEIIHCLPTGNWSSLRPLCKPFEEHCELPPRISHGIVTGDKEGDYYIPYEEAQVLCDYGYKCDGPEFVLCEEGGVWESEFGECKEIFCDTPPPLANGTILESTNLTSIESSNLTSFPYDFELTYVCDKNYRLIGHSWRVCGNKGVWTEKHPTCEVTQCPDPGIPEHGFRMADNYIVGSTVRFGCFQGYDLLGSVERHCLTNGQWSGELSRCDLPTDYCPNPGIPINGLKNSTNYDLGSIIEFRCQDGYYLLGSENRECLANHTWSGTEAKCLGRYDFDSEASIKEKLRNKISQIAEEQQMELDKYEKSKLLLGIRYHFLDYPRRTILYFAFDVSGSVGHSNFKRGIEFAKAIVKKVGISELGARAGALTFGSKAKGQFSPLQYDTTQDVLDALDDIEYAGGGADTSSALTLLKRDFLPLVHYEFGKEKVHVKSIVFIITDGKVNMGGNPTQEAKYLKMAGLEIYCIGITGDVRASTLYNIASKSKNEDGVEYSNAFLLQNYVTLSLLAQEITNGTTDYSQCGLGLENLGTGRRRIMEESKYNKPWPWLAALFTKTENEIPPKYKLDCAGSIIHRYFILTAAHCCLTYLEDGRNITVKLGFADTRRESHVQEFEVRNIFIHPKYRPGNFDCDIALLQLERPAEYNAFVRPICLPPKNLPDDSPLYQPKSSAWATGWDYKVNMTENDIRAAENFKEINLFIQSKEKCIESTRRNNVIISYFTDRMFCAGDGRETNDTCQVDSGGPLIQPQSNDEGYVYWTQVGIFSWGITCSSLNSFGYYTYLQRLVPWVEETMENALNGTSV